MRITFLLILVLLIGVSAPRDASAQADDIPDNCEYLYGEFYRPTLFPRYEPQNRRLMLVDWTTGAEVATLGTNLDDTLIRAWSADCRYLAVATGSDTSRATAVYDTIDARYIGEVPDARTNPHPLTWGVYDFLMVETRNGAVLWNVPQNIQYPLETGFNTTSYRNFDRLRWDAENYQVTGNLAVGGRIVVDLLTGATTATAASRPGEIILGGQSFPCMPTYSRRGGASVGGFNYSYVSLQYADSGGVISVGNRSETLVTLESGLAAGAGTTGWSINCRYVAGSLISTEQDDTYDTVIWDVLEGRRVATIPDARDTTHRLTWDTAEKHVLVETRDGAYLWDLATNTGVRVDAGVQAPPFNCESAYNAPPCRHISFHSVNWDAGRQQMLGVPVDAPDSIIAYDVTTGQEVTRYTVEAASSLLDFITSPNSRYLLAYADMQFHLFDRSSGAVTTFPTSLELYGSDSLSRYAAFSTDTHYLALTSYSEKLRVWDLTTTLPNAEPTYRYNSFDTFRTFVNADTLQFDGYSTLVRRFNVVTGDRIGDGWYTPGQMLDSAAQPTQSYTAVPGTTGMSRSIYWNGDPGSDCPVAVRYEEATRQIIAHGDGLPGNRVIASNINGIFSLKMSPDCRVAYAELFTSETGLPYETSSTDVAGIYGGERNMLFWDISTGTLFATIERTDSTKFDFNTLRWSPDGDRAVIHAPRGGEFLLHTVSQTVIPIRFQDTVDGLLPMFSRVYWDHERGIALIGGYGEVFAIDLLTGVEQLRFPVSEEYRGGCYNLYACGLSITPDGAWVFAYGDSGLSAWNLDTLAHAFLPVVSTRGSGGLVSPDGRYLIISRSTIRVWDLANLPETFDDRQPITTFVAEGSILSLTFVNNTTIEVITRAEGDSDTVTTRYDVRTGSEV